MSLMEYAAYLRIVPFAAQNHALNTPPPCGTSKSSLKILYVSWYPTRLCHALQVIAATSWCEFSLIVRHT